MCFDKFKSVKPKEGGERQSGKTDFESKILKTYQLVEKYVKEA
jgi:hypothetical protein